MRANDVMDGKMKKTAVILGGLAAFAISVCAMPTQTQIAEVRPLVQELMRGETAALKNGRKSRHEVADAAMRLAAKAESEAAKLLLMRGAFSLYARAGRFQQAIEALRALKKAIPDMPSVEIVSMLESALRGVPREKAEPLYRILDKVKIRARCINEIARLEEFLKTKPGDIKLQTSLAEHYAFLGKWDLALKNFADTDGSAANIAKSELDGGIAKGEVANFWWDYPSGKPEEIVKAFRRHAAEIYKKALTAGEIKGLLEIQAKRRIAEVEAYDRESASARVPEPGRQRGKYIAKPKHRDTKTIVLPGGATMEMIYVAPGSFTMGSSRWERGRDNDEMQHRVTLTKGFWLGKYEVTQRQWKSVMGNNPSHFKGDDLPVENVTWNDCQEFIRKVNASLNCEACLPTEAEWEYACRAGTTGPYAGGSLDSMGWYRNNSGGKTHPVGQKQPNLWGFYDMHGNVWEWCNDWYGAYPSGSVTDPTGSASGGNRGVLRGGRWDSEARGCRSANRLWNSLRSCYWLNGLRLCCSEE